MQYVFQKKFTVEPELLVASVPKTILLMESDPETSAMYRRHLSAVDLAVVNCSSLDQLLDKISLHRIDALIINPMQDLKHSVRVLRQARASYPNLPMVSIGGSIPDRFLDQLMAAGITMHINRYLTQPRDLYIAVQQILS